MVVILNVSNDVLVETPTFPPDSFLQHSQSSRVGRDHDAPNQNPETDTWNSASAKKYLWDLILRTWARLIHSSRQREGSTVDPGKQSKLHTINSTKIVEFKYGFQRKNIIHTKARWVRPWKPHGTHVLDLDLGINSPCHSPCLCPSFFLPPTHNSFHPIEENTNILWILTSLIAISSMGVDKAANVTQET